MTAKKVDREAALAAFMEANPPVFGNVGWAKAVLSDEDKELVARMYKTGYGSAAIARFLVELGYKDVSDGKVSSYIKTLPRRPSE